MKRAIITLCLSFSGLVLADSSRYDHEGIVTAEPDSADNVVISHQPYKVDVNTRLHGMIPGNEFGPAPRVGAKLGFNIEVRDDTLYITDLWPLDDEDD